NFFFSFFLFALAAAAFRWGFRETVATTVAAIVLVLLHARLAENVPSLSMTTTGEYPLDSVLFRGVYLAMAGMLLAFLADEGLLPETAAINGLLGQVRLHASVTRGLSAAAREITALVHAEHILIVIEDLQSRRFFRWDTAGGWGVLPSSIEPSNAYRDMYLFG